MPSAAHEAAAQFLFAARKRRTPGPRIPADCRPSSVVDALTIQQRVADLIGAPIGGWKCSLPSDARPVLAAPIFAPTIHTASPYPVIGRGATAKVEPEIAFVFARDLPARATPYGEGEIRAAIGDARLVLEIMGSRYEDPASIGFPELLADSVANQGLFVGPVVDDAFNRPLEAFTVTVAANGGALAKHDGKHPDAHPLRPLYWLANHLATTATPLRAGQIVTTGSYCGVLDVPFDQALTIRYGDLGTLSVTLTQAG
ncbi:MAG: 2-keto-4-pentenoate hydratase [Burkholderiales bacterium]|nr:2-keto-4-pentenoate hydratase [Burkholderiales bacterium]